MTGECIAAFAVRVYRADSAIRFGPDALSWKTCTSMQEYLDHGLYQFAASYAITFGTLVIANIVFSRNDAFVSLLSTRIFAYD